MQTHTCTHTHVWARPITLHKRNIHDPATTTRLTLHAQPVLTAACRPLPMTSSSVLSPLDVDLELSWSSDRCGTAPLPDCDVRIGDIFGADALGTPRASACADTRVPGVAALVNTLPVRPEAVTAVPEGAVGGRGGACDVDAAADAVAVVDLPRCFRSCSSRIRSINCRAVCNR